MAVIPGLGPGTRLEGPGPAPRVLQPPPTRAAAPRASRLALVFALFAGEELGLLSSDHQVRHPSPVPVERMVAMLNLRDGVDHATSATLGARP